jgi:hypothetical protein
MPKCRDSLNAPKGVFEDAPERSRQEVVGIVISRRRIYRYVCHLFLDSRDRRGIVDVLSLLGLDRLFNRLEDSFSNVTVHVGLARYCFDRKDGRLDLVVIVDIKVARARVGATAPIKVGNVIVDIAAIFRISKVDQKELVILLVLKVTGSYDCVLLLAAKHMETILVHHGMEEESDGRHFDC